ncbi:unnamed protein product [Mytilus coruscus]|uniref:Uncharacterized protein n=1 Tax=Mytilus coruscus TaxID=42192 RepID=A0A6J8BCG4_MYTCO|nr:unnamed protein product [Mytilus coruscus]
MILTTPGQKVHQKCRRDYINANSIKKDLRDKDLSTTELNRDLRSSTTVFEFQKNCLFCGNSAKFSESKRGIDVFPVRTTDFSKTLKTICKERNNEWSEIVLRRLNIAPFDLWAAETQDEPATISDLVQAMEEICGEKAYSVVHMKKRLQTHFGSDIIITEINGKSNIVTFRRTTSSILNKFYRRPSSKSPEDEKLSMIETAAKLIKADIMSLKDSKSIYIRLLLI